MLPRPTSIALSTAQRGAARRLERYDCAVLVVPARDPIRPLRTLAYGAELAACARRAALQPDTHTTLTLPNKRQTLAVIVAAGSDGEPFARQALAGRVIKAALQSRPQRVAVIVLGGLRAAAVLREAFVLALLTQAFELPRFTGRRRERRAAPLRSIAVDGASRRALERWAAAARAQNLARWLTALPPNKMDARGYRRTLARLVRTHRLRWRWYDERALRRLGAGAFLAVAAGNARRDAAGIAHLRYRPRGSAA
ncbi:MAG: hypothetical protein NZM12_09535, partial [Steroidobacteraceae bacterium]|nr:hypothetical protein [Steroidobacteraceae bacterium]